MENHVTVAQRLAMLQNWKQSDACKNICTYEYDKYSHLLTKGLQLYLNIDYVMSEAKSKTTSIAFSAKGNMHRGIHCPSPILDLLVGGVSRGRILKKVTSASKITHQYGYNEHGQLLYVESMLHELYTEYIVRDTDSIWGITVDSAGSLCAISEEDYLGGKLQRYTYAEMTYAENKVDCYQMHSEEYSYDDQGLCSCLWTEYIPMFNDIKKLFLCTFERKAGYIHSYTVVNQIWKQIDPNGTKASSYTPADKRKA